VNCQQALDRLYDMIDREASEIDAREIQSHLDHCRDCFEKYSVERSVQDFINEKLKNPKPSGDLGTLRQSILTKLDAVDEVENRPRRSLKFPAFVLASAASLAIIIGIWTLGSQQNQHSQIYGPLENLHARVASLVERPDSLELMGTVNSVCNRLGYELNPTVQDYELIDASITMISGVELGHFVYSDGEDRVSVFLAAVSEYEIPEDALKDQVVIDGTTFYDHKCRTCRLVFHQSGRTLVVTASSYPATDLLAFVPGHSTI